MRRPARAPTRTRWTRSHSSAPLRPAPSRCTRGRRTAGASGTLRYGLYRGTGTASPTGGTANTLTKKNSTHPTPTVADVRFDLTGAGLTTAGITYEADAFHVIALPVVELQVAVPATSAS